MKTILIFYLLFSLVLTVYAEDNYTVDIKIPTFLGNQYRRYYGKGPVPENPKILWKQFVGSGRTKVWNKIKESSGTGWPGQAILVEENGKLYILTGSYSYNLWKLRADTGKVAWNHKFNNVIKGTCNIFINTMSKSFRDKAIIFCGSRADLQESTRPVKNTNFRAVSFEDGGLLWKFGIPRTDCYSRDVDATGLISDDFLYLGAENGIFYFFELYDKKKNIFKPKIVEQLLLYTGDDIINHSGNLVIESYPAMLGDIIYVTAGSGHIFGIDKNSKTAVWNFYVGSDIDATPVITEDGFLLVGIEKQYIKGPGGVFKLDPAKEPKDAVEWYYPTENKGFGEWEGGVIGSVGITGKYAAFCSVDGYLYLVSLDELDTEKVFGPDAEKQYFKPKLIWKKKIGPSISTPIFVDGHLIACGYNGAVNIFRIENINNEIKITEENEIYLGGSIESTPIVWEGKIYVGAKDGYFYCIGDRNWQ